MTAFLVVLALVALLVVVTLIKSVRVVQQQTVGIVERFGKFKVGLQPGLNLLTPFVDKVRYTIDMREQVVAFPPQGVITEDNLMLPAAPASGQRHSRISATRDIAKCRQSTASNFWRTTTSTTAAAPRLITAASTPAPSQEFFQQTKAATSTWGSRPSPLRCCRRANPRLAGDQESVGLASVDFRGAAGFLAAPFDEALAVSSTLASASAFASSVLPLANGASVVDCAFGAAAAGLSAAGRDAVPAGSEL